MIPPNIKVFIRKTHSPTKKILTGKVVGYHKNMSVINYIILLDNDIQIDDVWVTAIVVGPSGVTEDGNVW